MWQIGLQICRQRQDGIETVSTAPALCLSSWKTWVCCCYRAVSRSAGKGTGLLCSWTCSLSLDLDYFPIAAFHQSDHAPIERTTHSFTRQQKSSGEYCAATERPHCDLITTTTTDTKHTLRQYLHLTTLPSTANRNHTVPLSPHNLSTEPQRPRPRHACVLSFLLSRARQEKDLDAACYCGLFVVFAGSREATRGALCGCWSWMWNNHGEMSRELVSMRHGKYELDKELSLTQTLCLKLVHPVVWYLCALLDVIA